MKQSKRQLNSRNLKTAILDRETQRASTDIEVLQYQLYGTGYLTQ